MNTLHKMLIPFLGGPITRNEFNSLVGAEKNAYIYFSFVLSGKTNENEIVNEIETIANIKDILNYRRIVAGFLGHLSITNREICWDSILELKVAFANAGRFYRK